MFIYKEKYLAHIKVEKNIGLSGCVKLERKLFHSTVMTSRKDKTMAKKWDRFFLLLKRLEVRLFLFHQRQE